MWGDRSWGPRPLLTLSYASRRRSRTGPDHGRPRRSDSRTRTGAPSRACAGTEFKQAFNTEDTKNREAARRARGSRSACEHTGSLRAASWPFVSSVLKACFVAHQQDSARFRPTGDTARAHSNVCALAALSVDAAGWRTDWLQWGSGRPDRPIPRPGVARGLGFSARRKCGGHGDHGEKAVGAPRSPFRSSDRPMLPPQV
jgi:hypothetical protein